MKCILCDKNEAVEHGLCSECLNKNFQVNVNGSVDITVCPKCESFKVGNRWYREGMKGRLATAIQKHLSGSRPNIDLNVISDSITINRIEGRIDFSVAIDNGHSSLITRSENIPSKILLNSCPTCNKVTGSYYEAIIQMRTFGTNYSSIIDEAMDRIDPFIINMENRSNDSFLSKIVRLPEGLDLYIGKKNDAVKMTKFLHENFFSEIKTTKKLAGRREGEDFYRYTFLVRLLNLSRGTVIHHEGREYLLEQISPNSLTLIDTATERRFAVQQNDFYSGSYSYTMEKAELRKYIVISNTASETELMDSIDFRTFTVKGLYSGEIMAFLYGGKLIPTEIQV